MDQNPKQAIVEKVKSAASVLVTVSTNPTVDQLSAAIGLTLMLGALDVKSAAVFSGDVPNVLEFLEPEKRLSKDINALRDFIISIDKEKADKLRYKVEDNVVKIFITPYKTTLSEDDLDFSQGDINVDLVIALGVHNKGDLDQAIVSHGRILHDATIASITAGGDSAPELGSINWHDDSASSLSEMLVSISEALKSGMLDKTMSTAFLTGIVAATERFSNAKTSPKVMTMSAQLMAAGADQQLIAKNLRMDRGRTAELVQGPPSQQADTTVLDLHADEVKPPAQPETLDQLEHEFEEKEPDPKVPELHVEEKPPEPEQVVDERKMIKSVKPLSTSGFDEEEPTLGGTFNATSQEAHELAEQDRRKSINREILSHQAPRANQTPLEPAQEPAVDIKPEEQVLNPPPVVQAQAPLPPPPAAVMPDTPPVDPIAEARKAVDNAVNTQEFDPAHHPTIGVGAQPLEMAETDTSVGHQIDIDPEGKLNLIGDQPTEVTENPLQPKVDAAIGDAFTLPKPVAPVQPLPPQPAPEPTLPPKSPPAHIKHDRKRLAEEPTAEKEASLPLGIVPDDEEKPVDNTFLVSSPSPENSVPSTPPPLPPKPASPEPPQPKLPENPLFNQQ